MYGRNGPDDLHRATVIFICLLMIAAMLTMSWVLWVLDCLMTALCLMRYYSRNIPRRREENMTYLRLTEKLRKNFRMKKTVLTDKEHYYKKCRKCRAYLRLPRRSGEHTAVCPKCGEKMVIKIKG